MKSFVVRLGLLFAILNIGFFGCLRPATQEERLVSIGSTSASLVAKKYRLSPLSFGTQGPGDIKGFTAMYRLYQQIEIPQARELIRAAGVDFVEYLNAGMQETGIVRAPFKIEDVYVSISFMDSSNEFISDPQFIARIALCDGMILFSTYRNDNFSEICREPCGIPQE